MFIGLTVLATSQSSAGGTTVTVTPDSMENWFFYNDETDVIDNTLGTFVEGPAAPPTGNGSVEISVSGTQRRNLATYQFSGTPLGDITEFAYSTYNPSAGNGGSTTRAGYLQFNVDFDGSDTWQRRLVFLPADNGTVEQDSWQEWDAINGGNALWRYSGPTWPVTGEAGTTTKTWDQILTDYPGVRIRVTDAFVGIRVGEPYSNGYTENLDTFKFGKSGDTTTYDFEVEVPPPEDKDDCKRDGWRKYRKPSFRNQGECVSHTERRDRDWGRDRDNDRNGNRRGGDNDRGRDNNRGRR